MLHQSIQGKQSNRESNTLSVHYNIIIIIIKYFKAQYYFQKEHSSIKLTTHYYISVLISAQKFPSTTIFNK